MTAKVRRNKLRESELLKDDGQEIAFDPLSADLANSNGPDSPFIEVVSAPSSHGVAHGHIDPESVLLDPSESFVSESIENEAPEPPKNGLGQRISEINSELHALGRCEYNHSVLDRTNLLNTQVQLLIELVGILSAKQ